MAGARQRDKRLLAPGVDTWFPPQVEVICYHP